MLSSVCMGLVGVRLGFSWVQRLLEDDGYLMVFTYHAEEDRSRFVVYDAKRFSDLPLAEVILPRRSVYDGLIDFFVLSSPPSPSSFSTCRHPCRVPFGFHGKFVTREEINSQEM